VKREAKEFVLCGQRFSCIGVLVWSFSEKQIVFWCYFGEAESALCFAHEF
jgi:hypothetical protein